MNKKKKIIFIAIVLLLFLTILTGVLCWTKFGAKEKNEISVSIGSTSRTNKFYHELMEKQSYRFTILDEKNTMNYVKKGNMAYLESIYQGNETKKLIKDGNTYLLVEDSKTYYTYQNNETDLAKIQLQLEITEKSEFIKGHEKIKGKDYNYEEYKGITGFLMKGINDSETQEVKTRFYFNDNKLEYIKTIVGEYQETLKVELSDKVDDKLFEIPSDYKQM